MRPGIFRGLRGELEGHHPAALQRAPEVCIEVLSSIQHPRRKGRETRSLLRGRRARGLAMRYRWQNSVLHARAHCSICNLPRIPKRDLIITPEIKSTVY